MSYKYPIITTALLSSTNIQFVCVWDTGYGITETIMIDDLFKTVFLEVLKSEYVQHTNCQLNIGSVTKREREEGGNCHND